MANAVIALIGVAYGVHSSRKAEKRAEKAEEVQSKRAALQNAAQRRRGVAQARRQRAAAVAQAEAGGIAGGSQISGVTGSLDTQAASNQAFSQQLEQFDQERFGALSEANRFTSRANLGFSAARFTQSGAGQELTNRATSFFTGNTGS